MTNGEKLEQVFPDGICPFSKSWLEHEYKEPSTKVNQDLTKIAVEEFANKILNAMDFSIKVTDSKDAYGVGMRNGIRYCKSLIDNKEPEFENVPENNVGEIEPTKNNLAVDKAKKESELIARGDVINMIKEIAEYHTKDSFNADRLIRNIKELPPATPIRPKGHWIPIYQGDEIIGYRCSECEFGNTFGKGTIGMNFCPNCGADNREEEE